MATMCGAKAKSTGEPCRRPIGPDATRCRWHGGAAPQAMAAARRRREEALAAQAVKTYGLPLDVSPTDALLDEVRWTAGHVAWLRSKVQELEVEALTWGRTKREDHGATEFPGVNTTEAAVPNVWVDLYARERKHLLDVCKAAIASGIEERKVRLAESQGALLASVIRAILDDLKLTPEQVAMVPEVVPRHLRAAS